MNLLPTAAQTLRNRRRICAQWLSHLFFRISHKEIISAIPAEHSRIIMELIHGQDLGKLLRDKLWSLNQNVYLQALQEAAPDYCIWEVRESQTGAHTSSTFPRLEVSMHEGCPIKSLDKPIDIQGRARTKLVRIIEAVSRMSSKRLRKESRNTSPKFLTGSYFLRRIAIIRCDLVIMSDLNQKSRDIHTLIWSSPGQTESRCSKDAFWSCARAYKERLTTIPSSQSS